MVEDEFPQGSEDYDLLPAYDHVVADLLLEDELLKDGHQL